MVSYPTLPHYRGVHHGPDEKIPGLLHFSDVLLNSLELTAPAIIHDIVCEILVFLAASLFRVSHSLIQLLPLEFKNFDHQHPYEVMFPGNSPKVCVHAVQQSTLLLMIPHSSRKFYRLC